jgi:hypothetical protein
VIGSGTGPLDNARGKRHGHKPQPARALQNQTICARFLARQITVSAVQLFGARFAQPLEQESRSARLLITAIARYPLVSPGRGPARLKHGTVRVMATKAERRAARERVSAYHESQLTIFNCGSY